VSGPNRKIGLSTDSHRVCVCVCKIVVGVPFYVRLGSEFQFQHPVSSRVAAVLMTLRLFRLIPRWNDFGTNFGSGVQPITRVLCITSPVESTPFFIPSTSLCSLSSWFTSSCAYHLITLITFVLIIWHLGLSLQT